jgi:hypothetical protein
MTPEHIFHWHYIEKMKTIPGNCQTRKDHLPIVHKTPLPTNSISLLFFLLVTQNQRCLIAGTKEVMPMAYARLGQSTTRGVSTYIGGSH